MESDKPWEASPTIEERRFTAAAYDANAEILATRYQSLRPEGRIKDVDMAFEYLGNKENPLVVELGCGSGREVAAILEHTGRYVGIDISRKMIEIAQTVNPDGRFGVSDIAGYEFPVGGVDIVFAFASLLHLDHVEVKKILTKAQAAMNTGGIFYISLKHGDYRREIKANEYGRRAFYYYLPEDIEAMAGNGFEVAELDEQIFENVPWFTVALRKK